MSNQLSFFEKLLTTQTERRNELVPPQNGNGLERLIFNEHAIEVRRRAYKRSMTLTIKPSGIISVSVGRGTSQDRILSFLMEHESWIEKNSTHLAQLRSRYPMPDFAEDCSLTFCGNKIKLKVRSSFSARNLALLEGEELYVYLSEDSFKKPESLRRPIVRSQVLKFYKEEGSRRLWCFVDYQASKMGVKPERVSFRAQKSRWGSCSSKGNISLNWKLIVAPLEVQSYVVTHELAHLRHMNHSKAFWALVADYCPNYKRSEEWLKHNHFEADFLSKESELHQPF